MARLYAPDEIGATEENFFLSFFVSPIGEVLTILKHHGNTDALDPLPREDDAAARWIREHEIPRQTPDGNWIN